MARKFYVTTFRSNDDWKRWLAENGPKVREHFPTDDDQRLTAAAMSAAGGLRYPHKGGTAVVYCRIPTDEIMALARKSDAMRAAMGAGR